MTEMWGQKTVEGTSSQLPPSCPAAVPEPRSGAGSGCSGRVRARGVGTVTRPAACGCAGGCLCHPNYFHNPVAFPWSEVYPRSSCHGLSLWNPQKVTPVTPMGCSDGSRLPASPCGEPTRAEQGHPRALHREQGQLMAQGRPSCCARPCDASTGTPRPCPPGHRAPPIRSLPPALCPRCFPSERPSRTALMAAVSGLGPVLRPRGAPEPQHGHLPGTRGIAPGPAATGRSGAPSGPARGPGSVAVGVTGGRDHGADRRWVCPGRGYGCGRRRGRAVGGATAGLAVRPPAEQEMEA